MAQPIRLGRPRKVDDEDVFRAFFVVLRRVGWARVTVSLVAHEVGVTPAALRQRFGPKEELLIRAYTWGTEHLPREGGEAPHAPVSWWDRLRAFVTAPVAVATTPSEMLNGISTFVEVAINAELHVVVRTRQRVALRRTEELLREGVVAGELVPVDTAALARQLQATLMGAALVWSVGAEGSIVDRLTAAAGQLLAPYVAGRAPDWVRGIAEHRATEDPEDITHV